MVKSISLRTRSLNMKWLMAILLGAILVPIGAYGGHDPYDVGHASMNPQSKSSSSCGSSAAWQLWGSAPEPTGTGYKKPGASLNWEEGYHDLDLKLVRPYGTADFVSEQGLGYINEEVYDNSPVSGTYTAYAKCFYFNSTRDTDGQWKYSVALTYWRT